MSYTSGVTNVSGDDFPLIWIAGVQTEQSMTDRMFGCGTLVITLNNGDSRRYSDLEGVENVRKELQNRVAAAN